MKKIWAMFGRGLFWLSWPALYVYLGRGERTRVIITADDRVLLVKGFIGNGHWILPGGGIHPGEDTRAGAVREVLEETGIRLSPAQLQEIEKGVAHEYGLKFAYTAYCARLARVNIPRRQKWELTDAAWLALPEILQRTDISPQTRRILSSWIRQQGV